MPKRKCKVVASLRFKIGDRIRVKRGVMDANYPDIPLGGWAGKIAEVHVLQQPFQRSKPVTSRHTPTQPMYLVICRSASVKPQLILTASLATMLGGIVVPRLGISANARKIRAIT